MHCSAVYRHSTLANGGAWKEEGRMGGRSESVLGGRGQVEAVQ